MERYLRRNRISEKLDEIGMAVLLLLLGETWFVWLWGLRTASLLAGAALGVLLWTARSQWRRHTVDRREKALRSRIGAELMLEGMLMAEAQEAHCQAAALLSQRWPIVVQSAGEEGVLCCQQKEVLLLRCVRLPPDGELSMGDLLAAQRAVKKMKAARAVLCVLGRASARMTARAETAPVPVRIIPRETLLNLAGQYAPATDAQLIELGRRRRRPAGQGHMLQQMFQWQKARRYHLYGLMMLLVYILTSSRLYAVPGMVCLTMGVMCRIGRRGREKL